MTRLPFTLPQIEHFLALAEECNFTRAAERCHIAQPPFSRSIQRLEEAVRTPLFTRHARGASLTETGEAFAQRARVGLAALHAAASDARAAQRTNTRLRIGMMEYAFAVLGPRFIDEFAREKPGLLVEPVDVAPEQLAIALKTGAIDLLFAAFAERTRLPARAGLRELLVTAEPMALLVDARHRLAGRSTVTLQELSRERLILFERLRAPAVHRAILLAFSALGLRPQVELEVGLLQTMFSAVHATAGAGLVPQSVQHLLDDGLRVVPIDAAQSPRIRLTLVWSAERETAETSAFVDWVRRHKPRMSAAAKRKQAAASARP